MSKPENEGPNSAPSKGLIRLKGDGRFDNLSDAAVLRLYDNIRHQVAADKALGSRYRLLGNSARERAEQLKQELMLREVTFTPIDW